MKSLFDKAFPPKPYGDGWWEKKFGEHVSLGPLVIYGFNAMHVAMNLRTPFGFVCFHPTFRVFGKWWPWYFYISRDGTPNSATVRFGHAYY